MSASNTPIFKGQMDDTPPFTQRFFLRARTGKSVLTTSLHDPVGFGTTSVDPMIVFSEHFERRHVADARGRVIGEDRWGYLDPEKRWRKINLQGVSAKYVRLLESEAQVYDRILSSACFSTP